MEYSRASKRRSNIQFENFQANASSISPQNDDCTTYDDEGSRDRSSKTGRRRGRRPGQYMNEKRRKIALDSAWRVLQAAQIVGSHPAMGSCDNSDAIHVGCGGTTEPSAGRKTRGRPRGSFKSEATRQRAIEAALRTLRVAGLADDIFEDSSVTIQSKDALHRNMNLGVKAKTQLECSSSPFKGLNACGRLNDHLYGRVHQFESENGIEETNQNMRTTSETLNVEVRLRIKPPSNSNHESSRSPSSLKFRGESTSSLRTSNNNLQGGGTNASPYVDVLTSDEDDDQARVENFNRKGDRHDKGRHQRGVTEAEECPLACDLPFKLRSSNGYTKAPVNPKLCVPQGKVGLHNLDDNLQALDIEEKSFVEADDRAESADHIHVTSQIVQEIERNVSCQLDQGSGNAAHEKSEFLVAVIENMVRSYRSSERPQRMALDAFVAIRTRPLAELLGRLQGLYMPFDFVQIASGVLKMAGVDIQEGRVSWPRTMIEIAYADGVEVARLAWPSTMEDLETGMFRSDRVWGSIFPQVQLSDMPPSCVILQCVCTAIGVRLVTNQLCAHGSSAMNACRVQFDMKSVASAMKLASLVASDSASKVLFTVP